MLVELLADGRCAAHIRLDGGNVGRRRVRLFSEQACHHERPARHRRRGRAVGCDFQNRRLSEEGAARVIRRQLDAANLRAAHVRNAIVGRQFFVEHREVRADQMARAQILLDQFAEEGPRLGDHRILQVGAEFRIELLVGVRRRDLPQLQPLAEKIFDEPLRLRVFQQAFDFSQRRTSGV